MTASRVRCWTALAWASWLGSACAPDEVGIDAIGKLDYDGSVERIESLGRYSSFEATLLLQLAGAPDKVVTENDYYLYRVTYHTEGVRGEQTRVSGLVAVPSTRDIKGIVSWHHGTNTYRPESISKPSSPEGLGIAALFAGDGYLLVAADYIGLGVSTEMHPYYHWPTTVGTVIDLLSIAETMLKGVGAEPDLDLYLVGFSEGGAATAAIQKALEQENRTGLTLRGAATIAAAFNLREISVRHAIQNDDTFHFGYLLAAFADTHGQSLDGIVRSPYKERLADWFDGTKDAEFLKARLPRRIDELLTERFLTDFHAGLERPQWFYDALRAATTDDYAPSAPLRIHFGSTDTIVIPQEAHSAFERMRAGGGNVQLVDVGPHGHDEVVLRALPPIQRWFDELERGAE